jgi:hypothetical protein
MILHGNLLRRVRRNDDLNQRQLATAALGRLERDKAKPTPGLQS